MKARPLLQQALIRSLFWFSLATTAPLGFAQVDPNQQLTAPAGGTPAQPAAGTQPNAAATPKGADDSALPGDPFAAALAQEEGNVNLDAAIQSYRAAIKQFDQQRQQAATAIFRLGECYRKLGRWEEAKVQYGRILREFPDQRTLANASQKHLFDTAPSTNASEEARFATRLHQIVNRADSATSGRSPSSAAPPSAEIQRPGGMGGGGGIGGGGIESSGRRYGAAGGGLGASAFGGASAGGYGSSGLGGASSFPGGFGSSELRFSTDERIQLQHELQSMRSAVLQSRFEVDRLGSLLGVVRDSPPEALPEPLKSDPRYAMLKHAYEDAVLNAESDKPVQAAQNKLRRWVEKIRVPELESEMQHAQRQHTEWTARADEIQKKLASLEEASRIANAKSAIIQNLRHLDAAKEQWALENRKTAGSIPTAGEIGAYLRGGMPHPVAGEVYELNPIGKAPEARLTAPVGDLPAGTRLTAEGPVKP